MNGSGWAAAPESARSQRAGAALRAEGVRASLGGRQVLHGIDLEMKSGRWIAIVGPNGAGKSTLVKALARLLPHAGQVHLLGRNATSWGHKEHARALAWLGQNEPGAEDLLAHDVVMLGRLPHQDWLGSPHEQDQEAVQAAMQETQCWDWRDRSLGSLSGGERQRVLLARALAVGAQVLVMDEPLANLDPPHQADWMASVRKQVALGATVVSVLHELTIALHADDLVILDQGRVVHHGACTDPRTHRALEQVFDWRIGVQPIGGQWVAVPA